MTQESSARANLTAAEMHTFVVNYTDAVCKSNVQAMVAFKAKDAVSASGQEPGRVMSPSELNAYIEERQWSFPDFKFTASNIIVDPERGIATYEWKVTGTFTNPFKGIPPNHRQVIQHGTTELQIEDKLIVRETSYQDMNTFMSQLLRPAAVDQNKAESV